MGSKHSIVLATYGNKEIFNLDCTSAPNSALRWLPGYRTLCSGSPLASSPSREPGSGPGGDGRSRPTARHPARRGPSPTTVTRCPRPHRSPPWGPPVPASRAADPAWRSGPRRREPRSPQCVRPAARRWQSPGTAHTPGARQGQLRCGPESGMFTKQTPVSLLH